MIKKHLLTKQKGIDSCSLLPQKWLVCLLTLLATFVGSGRMWADESLGKFVFTSSTIGLTSDEPPKLATEDATIGSNSYFTLSVNKLDANLVKTVEGDNQILKLQSSGYIDISFTGNVIKAGDKLIVGCANAYDKTYDVGFKINGDDKTSTVSSKDEIKNVEYIIQSSDITMENGANHIKIYRINQDNGYNSVEIVSAGFDYSLTAKNGGNTLATVASGHSATASIAVAYPRYVLSGTTLYGIPQNGGGADYWRTTLDLSTTAKDLNYSETVADVVFYTEAENISGFTAFDNTNRASNGKGARSGDANTYKNATTLNKGRYKIIAHGVNANSATRTCNFKVGSDVVYTFSIAQGIWVDGTSAEFTVSQDGTNVSVACEGSNASGLDYFYIIKTSNEIYDTDANNHKIYTGNVVGDGTNGFRTAYSNYFELASGQQYHFTFHIEGGDKSWKNWFLEAAKTQAHEFDTDYSQLLRIRADKFTFDRTGNFHLYKNSMSNELNADATNINDFGDSDADAALKSGNVDMTVTYADNRLFIYAKTTGTNGTNIYLTGVQEIANEGNPVQLFFGIEEAIISNLVAEKKTSVIKNVAVYNTDDYSKRGTEVGTYDIKSVDDIIYPYYLDGTAKVTYLSVGQQIKIYADAKPGSRLTGIGNSETSPRVWTQTADNLTPTFWVTFVPNGVDFELNGGQCDVVSAPLNQEFALPKPTKAGSTFIGWMTASNGTTPDAGLAGQNRTYTTKTTLYALWYTNNCEIDFTSSGPLAGTDDKTWVSISETDAFMAGGTPVGNITIGEHTINSRFGVQTGTNWMYRNGGLYSNNSGGRAYGLNGCTEGEYITIVSSADPNVNTADAELVSQDGNTYTYKVKKDGSVKFTPARYSNLYSVTVASPCPHTVWTNGNVAYDKEGAHTADWWQNWSPFYNIKKGQTLNFKFTIHGGDTTYDNWCLIAQTGLKHNGDLGLNSTTQEKLLVRADGYCWGVNCTGNASITKEDSPIDVNSGWRVELNDADFVTINKNAVVDMTVEYSEGGVLTVTARTIVDDTEKYVLTKSSTAISNEDVLALAFEADDSWIEGITHPIKFANTTPKITTSSTGTITYSQPALGAPEGTWVKYEVINTTGKVDNPSVSQIEGSSEYILNIKGTGTVTVRATCGGNTATYTLTVEGLMFEKPSPYIAHGKTWYNSPLTDGTVVPDKVEIVKYDTTPCLRDAKVKFEDGTCKIYDIPTGDDKGGIIVIRATKGDAVAECCLTVAYDLHVWDMYSDPLKYGTLVKGNAQDEITGDGETMNEDNRVGSAHYVIYNSGNSYTYHKTVNGVDQEVTDGDRVAYNNWMDGQDYYAKENWYNAQTGTKTCNVEGDKKNYDVLHDYWRFTYKTCSYKDGVRTYVNEPLFAYKNTVIGDNGRIIKQTAGLRFNAPALHFGVSDNDTKDAEGGSSAIREQDRCVLLKVGSRLCIPRVKEGRYIRVHWYRHSDNNGDKCRITNGVDLDGREINPEHVIRFTGSHYYEDHKGSFVFKVTSNPTNEEDVNWEYDEDRKTKYCDVFIDPYGIGWVEFYRIEIMDKFDSELQLAEVDVANKITADQVVGKRTSADIGKPYATTNSWNSRDLNNVDNYNRSVFDATEANHPVLASRLVSRIRTKAKADAEGGDINTPVELEDGKLAYAPELYISGYPGHCFTWNGWMNTTLQAEFYGSARCKVVTKTDSKDTYTHWSQENTIPNDPVWVGNNIQYTMHALKEVCGEGTIKLTLRTHSGWEGEPHYTFDKREAIVAVGQYSVQEYPYTWDFTNYNFGLNNKYGSKTFDAMKDDAVNKTDTKEYGHWRKNSDNVWSMHAYQTNISSSMGGHTVKDDKKLNKPYFAQGAQLSLGTDASKHTILETEGLRVTIPALTTGTDLVKLVESDEATDTDRGYMTICSGGTITIPEVTAGMYVFVKSSTAPTSTTHTTGSDVAFASNNDGKGNVTYYKATGGDVTLTFNSGATLYKIGVTDQVKDINAYGYSTESRKYDIDHNETRYFSANVSAYYVGNYSKSSSKVDETKVQDDAYIPKFTGVMLHDDVAGAEKAAYKIPLFVPACNITEDHTAEGNCMMPTTTVGNITSNMAVPAVDGDYTNYTLTNLYGKVQNSTVPTYGSDHTIGFYKFYGGSMAQNKSYLHLPTSGLSETSKVKGFIFLPGSEMDDEESTPIKTVEVDIDDDAEYFTVNGLKLNGAPTKSGVYIKNGQKVYVK